MAEMRGRRQYWDLDAVAGGSVTFKPTFVNSDGFVQHNIIFDLNTAGSKTFSGLNFINVINVRGLDLTADIGAPRYFTIWYELDCTLIGPR